MKDGGRETAIIKSCIHICHEVVSNQGLGNLLCNVGTVHRYSCFTMRYCDNACMNCVRINIACRERGKGQGQLQTGEADTCR